MVKIVNSSKFSFAKFGRIRNFLVILVSGIIFITAFLFLKDFLVKAQEQIEIFPVVYTGNWQNPEAAFFQDLGQFASFEEFNPENSAYPLEIHETTLKGTQNNTKLGFFEKIKNLFRFWSVEAEEATTTQEATSTIEEATPTQEYSTSTPEEVTPMPEEETPTVETVTPIEKFLEFSGFFVSDEIKKTEIKNVQLRISLAGKGNPEDKLVIEYFYQDSWQTLIEFNLEEEISNSLNGGYFLYTLPIFENWQDLENLKIRFIYQSQNIEPNSKVYLDSLWLEAEIGEKELPAKILKRKDFRSNEDPEFLIPKKIGQEKRLLEKLKAFFLPEFKINQAILVTPDGRETVATFFIEEIGENYHLRIKPDQNFKPGKYLLKLEIERGGEIENLEQEFTWGVLAINVNKSIFTLNNTNKNTKQHETAYLQMAALRDDGHTICDANLKLEIISPSGQVTIPEIQKSGECGPNNVTSVPDYFAYYQVGGPGIYRMRLTRLAENSSPLTEIEDFFEVRESVPFEVERQGPTRIYPPAIYEMTLRIKVNQDFVGEIVETVPSSFEIISHETTQIRTPKESLRLPTGQAQNNTKEIVWQVDWKIGESYELKYQFNAPDVSPYLYLLGPLEFYE